jgi:DNA-directed RNA polymerase specialized sigma24 family protein
VTARQLFALACQYRRWEPNDMARRLDEQPEALELRDESMPVSTSSDTGLTPDRRGLLASIDRLPEGECEASDLVRTQGMSQAEADQVLAVSVMTVHRRLSRGLNRLAATLGDLCSGHEDPAGP